MFGVWNLGQITDCDWPSCIAQTEGFSSFHLGRIIFVSFCFCHKEGKPVSSPVTGPGGGGKGPCFWWSWLHPEVGCSPFHVGSCQSFSSLLHTSLPASPLRSNLVWITMEVQLMSRNAICKTGMSSGANDWLQGPPLASVRSSMSGDW